ncbi:hypothetical protein [Hymenobacter sp. PAMC 26628]|nr:hypothetical protein [Hymenobacter sp. PAMC 26628]
MLGEYYLRTIIYPLGAGEPAGALFTVQGFCGLTGLDPAEVSEVLSS